MKQFVVETPKGIFSDVELIGTYRRWRDRSDWLKFERRSCVLKRNTSGDCRFSIDAAYYAVKVAKRGNDVYQSKVKRRFLGIADSLSSFNVFRMFTKRSGEARAFFVTLTWDVGYCKAEEAWQNDSDFSVSRYYNRWISGLRRRFGKVDVVRVWDSGKQGYPHPHVLVVLRYHWLPVFAHRGQNGKATWRLEETERSLVKGNWPFFVDVSSATSITHALGYMNKRAGCGTAYGDLDDHGDRTLALTWAFRKRGYGISGDLIVKHRNSNQPVSGSDAEIWSFLGVFSNWDLEVWAEGRPYWAELGPVTSSAGGAYHG